MTITKSEAIDKLWRMGRLEWKLKGIQKEMHSRVYTSTSKRTVLLCGRRSGKTYTTCTIAVEHCLRIPDCVVKYLCPKAKDAKTILRPIMRQILEDCPLDLAPEWKEADKVYSFPNGSVIQIAGTDNGSAESLRGGYAHLCILDEAGFMDDLNYNLLSILSPTTKTTKGKIILASTPSRDPNHEFLTDFVLPLKAEGNLVTYTIYDNPMFDEQIILDTIAEYPQGKEDPQFRREYLCELDIQGDTNVVIPELTTDLEKDIVCDQFIPPYYDAYVSMDPGSTDLTVALFGYYDFLRAKLVIIDELVLGGEGTTITTQPIADGIFRKERMWFVNSLTGEVTKPTMRIMDNNAKILLQDLQTEHSLDFFPTQKDGKLEQVNKLRLMLNRGQIEINPRCVNLLYHMKSARWKNGTSGKLDFLRVKASSDGKLKAHHCDALDALLYMVRNVDFNRNPYPSDYNTEQGEHIFNSNKYKSSNKYNDFAKAMFPKLKINN